MTAPAAVLIDGRPTEVGIAFDRGLHYGDGLFETVSIRGGVARFLALHEARLAIGCARLGIACDPDLALARSADGLTGKGTLKVIVTRGDAVARGYGTSGAERPRVIRFWYPGASPAPGPTFAVATLGGRWGENPALAGLKHLNRLEQVLSRRELAQVGGDEGLVLSSTGDVVSGTMGNVFLHIDDRWVTPRVDRCGIAGVMRQVVLREAPAIGIAIEEARVASDALARVHAAFVTNARIGVRVATALDGRPLAQPAGIADLARRIESLDA